MLISVIIPVYNVKSYLDECVQSVLNQKNVDYEIILVDDESSDGSEKLCDDWAAKYDFIRVIHKENQGLGFARNSGLDVAKGKYIVFLDSDDIIPKDTLCYLGDLMEREQCDIVNFQFRMETMRERIAEELSKERNQDTGEKEQIERYKENEIWKDYLLGKICGTAWTKMYKREIFDKVRFSKVPLHEDTYSMHLFLNEAKKIVSTNRICYIQYRRPGSLIQSTFSQNNFIEIECGKRVYEFIKDKAPEYTNFARAKYLLSIYDVAETMLYRKSEKKYRKEFYEISESLRGECEFISNMQEIDKTNKKRFVLFAKHPWVYMQLYHFIFFKAKLGNILRRVKGDPVY